MHQIAILVAVVSVFVVAFNCLEQPGLKSTNRCDFKQVADRKWICVCNKDSCDELYFDWPTQSGQTIQVESSASGKHFQVRQSREASLNDIDQRTIRIKVNESHQTILGWGGAFTDSAALNINKLSEQVSQKLIEGYFGENGLQYNLGRVPMAGSDFSSREYTYADVQDDLELKNWTLASEDTELKIPLIKKAMKACQEHGDQLKLLSSPWTAPKWMKTSNSYVRGSLIDKDEIYKAYANYFIKFFQAYSKNGIDFWGTTVQNEPMSAYLPFYYFTSMQFGPSHSVKFITKYLGPALVAQGMTKDKFKLIIGDDSLGFVEPLITQVLNDPEARKFVSGYAFHWYTSGSLMSYDRLTKLYNKFGDKIDYVIMTEACNGWRPFAKKMDLGSWDRGEAYAMDIIEDMSRQTNAWIDWNLALNKEGGPNWAKNLVDSPIIVDSANDQFFKQPMYYVLGHFSRLMKAGSIKVPSSIVEGKKDVLVLSARNDQSGHLIINILNRSDKSMTINVLLEGTQHKIEPIQVDSKSVNSVVLKL